MSSPPNRSQMGGKPGTTAAEKSLNQSGFGGWVDEKIEVPREAGPLLLAQRGQRMRPPKISSTTFDNTSNEQNKGRLTPPETSTERRVRENSLPVTPQDYIKPPETKPPKTDPKKQGK